MLCRHIESSDGRDYSHTLVWTVMRLITGSLFSCAAQRVGAPRARPAGAERGTGPPRATAMGGPAGRSPPVWFDLIPGMSHRVPMSRLVRIVLLLGAVLASGVAARQPAPSRPNILVIIGDDWSYPHAGAYSDRSSRRPLRPHRSRRCPVQERLRGCAVVHTVARIAADWTRGSSTWRRRQSLGVSTGAL